MSDRAKPSIDDLERRRVVQALGLASVVSLPWNYTAAQSPELKPVAPQLRAFPLRDVRIAGGPFLEAQRRDERYLLQLQPDRMLHNVRVNAGLKPKALVYGGWESQEPWVEIRCHGHTLGHYLSACALMFASTERAEFKARVDYIVQELDACQTAAKSGLVTAFPDSAQQLINSVQGKEFSGVPWYTMHKILAGLRDAHLHTQSALALTVWTRLSDALGALIAPLSDEQMQKMLEREHGGMNEIMADLFAITGEPKHLAWANKFSHRALLQPLVERRDVLDGLHSNTQIPKVIGYERIYELTGRDDHHRAAEFFWKTIVDHRTYATGGNGDREFFFPPREFEERLQSAKTMETCCMHNMLRLTRALFSQDPTVTYADYYERTLFNGILASQDPDSGMMTYFQATRPGYVKLFCTPEDSFWCCTGSGMENHAKYGDSIYFHEDAALYVNLFIDSTLNWRDKGIRVRQETQFPLQANSRLTINVDKPISFALRIRQPGWCAEASMRVNGSEASPHRTPGRYIEIQRTWRNGDRIDIELPMQLHLEPLPSTPDIAALMYGPIVLVGRMGTTGLTRGADIIVNERQSGDMLNIPRELPVWKLNRSKLDEFVARTNDRALTFKARGVDELPNLELVPYYSLAHERYNMYWRMA